MSPGDVRPQVACGGAVDGGRGLATFRNRPAGKIVEVADRCPPACPAWHDRGDGGGDVVRRGDETCGALAENRATGRGGADPAGAIDCPAAARELAAFACSSSDGRKPKFASAAMNRRGRRRVHVKLLATSRFVQITLSVPWARGTALDSASRSRACGRSYALGIVSSSAALGVEVGSVVTPTHSRVRAAACPAVGTVESSDYRPLPGGPRSCARGSSSVRRGRWDGFLFRDRSACSSDERAVLYNGALTGGARGCQWGGDSGPIAKASRRRWIAAPWGGLMGVRASAERSLQDRHQPRLSADGFNRGRRVGERRIDGPQRPASIGGEKRRGRIGMRTALRGRRPSDAGIGDRYMVGGSGFAVASGAFVCVPREIGAVLRCWARPPVIWRRAGRRSTCAGWRHRHGRQTMLRGHPARRGQLRVDRLGRHLVDTSVEDSTAAGRRARRGCRGRTRMSRERRGATGPARLAISTWAQGCVSR